MVDPLGLALGVPAAVAVAVVLLSAPLVYRSGRVTPRALVLLVMVCASVMVTIELPTAFPTALADLRGAARYLLAILLAYLTAKLLLLHRYASVSSARVRPNGDLLRPLLEFQLADLERLSQAILDGDTEAPARVVQVVGRWGDAKSFLLERLAPYLDTRRRTVVGKSSDRCAVVLVNVWEQQSEPDLHLAIVEQILSHRRYWYPYGWLRYPLSLHLARVFKEAKLAISAGRQATAKLEMPLSAPRPTGKRTLEKLVARVRGRGVRTVVVLDEIDRAAPPVAQAAVTLALRSLDLPGMVVVLSYVDEVMRYKAFNPLVETLPDLGSTMRAVIYAVGPERASADNPGGILSVPPTRGTALADWKAWQEAGLLALPDAAKPHSNGGQTATVNYDCGRASASVRLGYAYASRGARVRLQRSFAEKYLGQRPIQLQRLGPADVAGMVIGFASLEPLVRELVGAGVPLDEVRAAIIDALRGYSRDEPPSIRALEGELYRRLSGIGATGLSPRFVAAVVLAAYHSAALKSRTR